MKLYKNFQITMRHKNKPKTTKFTLPNILHYVLSLTSFFSYKTSQNLHNSALLQYQTQNIEFGDLQIHNLVLTHAFNIINSVYTSWAEITSITYHINMNHILFQNSNLPINETTSLLIPFHIKFIPSCY